MNNKQLPSTIPQTWILASLDEITVPSQRINRDYQSQSDTFTYIDIESIDNSKFKIDSPKRFLWMNAPSRAQQIIATNDILFSTVRPYLKNIALVPTEYNNQIASSGFCVLRPVLVNPLYLFYFTISPGFIEAINNLAKGTSYPAVTSKAVLAQLIPLPPLREQHRIVAKVEQLFSELNKAVDYLNAANKLLNIYKQSFLKDAFDGKLTQPWRTKHPSSSAVNELLKIKLQREKNYNSSLKNKVKQFKPNHDFKFTKHSKISTWATAVLNNLIEINARIGWRGLKKEEYKKTGPLLISVDALNFGKNVSFHETIHISKLRYDESPEIRLEKDDILLCKDGAGIGKIGIVKRLPAKATINSSLLLIRAKGVFIPDYLYYMLSGPLMQQLVNEKISGSAVPHLFQKDIKQFKLNVPPRSEQIKIVEAIELRITLAEDLRKTIDESFQRIEVLRNVILKRAFEGTLVEQNESDNEDINLLEQIKKVKEELVSSNKEIQRLKPKPVKMATKNELTALQLLKQSKTPIAAKDLWLRSKHKDNIEDFYEELKEILELVKEVKNDTESLLTLRQ